MQRVNSEIDNDAAGSRPKAVSAIQRVFDSKHRSRTLESTINGERLGTCDLNVSAPMRENADLAEFCIPFGKHSDSEVETLTHEHLREVADEKVGSARRHSSARKRRNDVGRQPGYVAKHGRLINDVVKRRIKRVVLLDKLVRRDNRSQTTRAPAPQSTPASAWATRRRLYARNVPQRSRMTINAGGSSASSPPTRPTRRRVNQRQSVRMPVP